MAHSEPPVSSKPKTLIDVRPLTEALEQFAREREWTQFHSPKNLVMALSGEVGELTEIFQWLTEAQSHDVAKAPSTEQAVRDELADVLLYLVRLASVLGVDLDQAVQAKLQKNAQKYPIDKAKGTSKKYTDL